MKKNWPILIAIVLLLIAIVALYYLRNPGTFDSPLLGSEEITNNASRKEIKNSAPEFREPDSLPPEE